MVVADRKRAALRAHWLDAAIVVLTAPLVTDLLASLRLLRLARLLRLTRASLILGRAIQAERALSSGPAFKLVALMTAFVVVIGGAAQAAFDANEFPSVWDGIWWAVVTVTTIGYGDLYRKDVEGATDRDGTDAGRDRLHRRPHRHRCDHFVTGDVEAEA